MNKRLYEFLKSKGCEFCYKDKEPFLIDNRVPHEWLTEYAELVNKNDLSHSVIVPVCGICGEPTKDELSKICRSCWELYDTPQTEL